MNDPYRTLGELHVSPFAKGPPGPERAVSRITQPQADPSPAAPPTPDLPRVEGRTVTLRELHTGGKYDADSRVQSSECDLCSGGHFHIRCDCADEMTGYIIEPNYGGDQELHCPRCGLTVVVSEEDSRWFDENVDVF